MVMWYLYCAQAIAHVVYGPGFVLGRTGSQRYHLQTSTHRPPRSFEAHSPAPSVFSLSPQTPEHVQYTHVNAHTPVLLGSIHTSAFRQNNKINSVVFSLLLGSM